MRGIKSHKKRLLKKYKWSSKIMQFTVTGPYERRFVKNMMKYVRSSHMLKNAYKRSPDAYHDEISLGVSILLYTMPQVIASGCNVTPTKYNNRIRAKSKIKKEAQ